MKKCSICKKSFPLSDFNKCRTKRDGHQDRCRTCDRALALKRYRESEGAYKETILKRRQDRIREKRDLVYGYFLEHPCVDCGEDDPIVLDFDHLHSKESCISTLVQDDASWKRISREIAKCEVRCANCHRRKTARTLGWYVYEKYGSVAQFGRAPV